MYSILGVKIDLILVLRSQFFEFLCETFYKHALEHLEAAGPENNGSFFILPTVNAYLSLTSLKVCDRWGYIFGASASPRSLPKKLATSPFSTVHGDQYDTKYMAFELLLIVHASFVADEISGFMLEPARTGILQETGWEIFTIRAEEGSIVPMKFRWVVRTNERTEGKIVRT